MVKLEAPDGELLAITDKTKAEWYVKKGVDIKSCIYFAKIPELNTPMSVYISSTSLRAKLKGIISFFTAQKL